ncbi:hypothetical protein TGVAND_211695 [Toxoplasma gondii VAND]|uniref:Uncharacterized protein n=1 Tax=Toxoplasma gondii VAND TaxID=933077 RepID=A0A086PHP2_TOXGO|nr:hypothetical protein TGVAND_211695 [Toxoplasma gondii VAND]
MQGRSLFLAKARLSWSRSRASLSDSVRSFRSFSLSQASAWLSPFVVSPRLPTALLSGSSSCSLSSPFLLSALTPWCPSSSSLAAPPSALESLSSSRSTSRSSGLLSSSVSSSLLSPPLSLSIASPRASSGSLVAAAGDRQRASSTLHLSAAPFSTCRSSFAASLSPGVVSPSPRLLLICFCALSLSLFFVTAAETDRLREQGAEAGGEHKAEVGEDEQLGKERDAEPESREKEVKREPPTQVASDSETTFRSETKRRTKDRRALKENQDIPIGVRERQERRTNAREAGDREVKQSRTDHVTHTPGDTLLESVPERCEDSLTPADQGECLPDDLRRAFFALLDVEQPRVCSPSTSASSSSASSVLSPSSSSSAPA